MIFLVFVIAIMFSFYMMRKERIRREREHDRRQERFERLIEQLKKSNEKENSEPENKTT